ncbi:MAG: hypothetical protein ACQEXX_16600 [Bacillota bacterium]
MSRNTAVAWFRISWEAGSNNSVASALLTYLGGVHDDRIFNDISKTCC